MVCEVGFEPTTPRLQTGHSDQTELLTDILVAGVGFEPTMGLRHPAYETGEFDQLLFIPLYFGGGYRDRTGDLLRARQVLSQHELTPQFGGLYGI